MELKRKESDTKTYTYIDYSYYMYKVYSNDLILVLFLENLPIDIGSISAFLWCIYSVYLAYSSHQTNYFDRLKQQMGVCL